MQILFVVAFKRPHNVDRSRAAKLFFSQSKDHLLCRVIVTPIQRESVFTRGLQELSRVLREVEMIDDDHRGNPR